MNKTTPNKVSTAILIVSVIFLVCALFIFTVHIGEFTPEQIGRITVWDGLTDGSELEITDAETISRVVRELNDISPAFGIRVRATGCHYAVRLYDTGGNVVADIELTDSGTVCMDRCSYWCDTANLIEYLTQLKTAA